MNKQNDKSSTGFTKRLLTISLKIIFVIATILLASYAYGTNEINRTKARFEKIEIGMTNRQVEKIIGKPDSSYLNSKKQSCVWTYRAVNLDRWEIQFNAYDNRVHSILFSEWDRNPPSDAYLTPPPPIPGYAMQYMLNIFSALFPSMESQREPCS